MKIKVGEALYLANKSIVGKLEIQKLYIIAIKSTWVYIGYDNHPNAFLCNHRSHEDVRVIYSDTPEQAVEKYKEGLITELIRRQESIQEELVKLGELFDCEKNISFDDFTLRVQEYNSMDDLF